MGVTAVDTMAYPFGDYNAAVQTIAQNAGYAAARGTDYGYNTPVTNKFALKVQQVDRTTTLAQVQAWVSEAAQNKVWLILMFHQIDADMNATLGITPEFLGQIVSYVSTVPTIDVVTVRQGAALMNP